MSMTQINSNLKLISSGNIPTTTNLQKGEMAFGKISSDSNKIHLYLNADGSQVTDLQTLVGGGG